MTTTLQDQMTIILTSEGGGMAKFAPAVSGRVFYDSYFDGKLVSHTTLKTEKVADQMLFLMRKGYTVQL